MGKNWGFGGKMTPKNLNVVTLFIGICRKFSCELDYQIL
jgi:hypothetical protein